HDVRVVLADASAERERLRGGGPDAGRAVPVGHRLVHPVVDVVRQRQAPLGGLGQLIGGAQDPVVGGGQPRRLEEVAVGQPAVGQPVWLGGSALHRDLGGGLDRVVDARREDAA